MAKRGRNGDGSNGSAAIPAVQIEFKTLGISPRRAIEQIVEYRNDPGNGYTRTLHCFVQLFIVSNRTHIATLIKGISTRIGAWRF